MTARIIATRTIETCVQCGYDLHGLPRAHYRCPECGTEYESALRPIPVYDPFDSNSLPPLSERIKRLGMKMILLVIIGVLAFQVLTVLDWLGIKHTGMAY